MTHSWRLGVCYYPEHWPESQWPSDARRMREAGISIVRIGEFAWSRIEPSPGNLHFEWLQRAIEVLAAEGLDIVLGTPTATPPAWLVKKMPDMLAVDASGRVREFGSRRHYCFSHSGYREQCVRIVSLLAERFGDHAAIVGWQIDNEYGCHDTTLSFSRPALQAFREWLAGRYSDIETLNRVWGNVFWSMEYSSFADIELPQGTVTEANPAHWLDFYRFSSDQVIAFNRLQVEIVRAHSPQRDVIHNCMGRILDFDHFDLGADLDVVSWDAYPLGFLEDRVQATAAWKKRYLRTGDPDFQAFHHDLYRAAGRGRWWVMEQQPGPVNWANYNPSPRPGMVRLWTWEAFAHGAEVVSYFRWRQLPFAQEQMHAGLYRSDDEAAPARSEVVAVGKEIEALNSEVVPSSWKSTADVCLVFDYPSAWAWRIQPQGKDFDYFELIFHYYRTLRALGLSVDFASADSADFTPYPLVVVAGVFSWNASLLDAIRQYRGQMLIGPRSGSKTDNFAIPAMLPPDLATDILDLRVTHVESLPSECGVNVAGRGALERWREFAIAGPNCRPVLSAVDGEAVLLQQQNRFYLAGWPDSILLDDVLRTLCKRAGVVVRDLPEGVRVRRSGDCLFVLNYSDQPFDCTELEHEFDGHSLLGTRVLPPTGVAAIRLRSDR